MPQPLNPAKAPSADYGIGAGREEKMPKASQQQRHCDPAASAAIAKMLAKVQERLEQLCAELETGTGDVHHAQDAIMAKSRPLESADTSMVRNRPLENNNVGDTQGVAGLRGPSSRWASAYLAPGSGPLSRALSRDTDKSGATVPYNITDLPSAEVVRFELLSCWRAATKQTYADLVSDKLEPQPMCSYPRANSWREVLDESKCCLIMPGSRFYIAWNMLFMLVLCYETVIFPMSVFNIQDEPLLIACSHFTVSFWTADILVSVFSAHVTEGGDLVTARWSICKHYAKSWLLPDLAVVMVDWVSLISFEGGGRSWDIAGLVRIGKVLRYFRILRAMRFLRLRKVSQAMQMLDDIISSPAFNVVTQLVFNMMTIIILAHFTGCLWFVIGSTPPTDNSPTWVEEYEFDRQDWLYCYLTSLHWAVTQFTPGSMSVQPTNGLERIFAVFVLVLGMIIFSSIVSSITAATTALRTSNAKYGRQLWMLKKYIRQQRISKDLAHRISRFAATVIQPKQNVLAMDDVEILRMLPESLRRDVTMEVTSPHLVIHPFFDRFAQQSKSALAQVCFSAVTMSEVSKQSEVFGIGQQAHAMYFITSGSFTYSQPHLLCEEELQVKSWLCEAVLWTTWVHQGVLAASTESTILAVDAQHFQRVVSKHQADARFAQQYGTKYVAMMNSLAGLDTEETDDDCQLNDIIPTRYLQELVDNITTQRLNISKSVMMGTPTNSVPV